jgi:hypothetical protein
MAVVAGGGGDAAGGGGEGGGGDGTGVLPQHVEHIVHAIWYNILDFGIVEDFVEGSSMKRARSESLSLCLVSIFFCFLIELIDNKFSRSMELEQAKGKPLTNNLRERERR